MDLRREENGSALLTVFFVIIALTFLGMGLMQYAMSGYRQEIHSERRAMAYYVARSGVDAFVSYAVDNPDSLSVENMGSLIDSAVSAGQSAPTPLGEGSFTISLAEHSAEGTPDEIVVTSRGTVKGITETVRRSIVLTPGGSAMPPIDCAVFSLGSLKMHNKARITGDVGTNSTAADSVVFTNSAWVDGTLSVGPLPTSDPGEKLEEIKKIVSAWGNPMKSRVDNGEVLTLPEERSYPLPEFPAYPALPRDPGKTSISLSGSQSDCIEQNKGDVWYNRIDLANSARLDIEVGHGTRRIRVDSLSISNTAKIRIIGEGKLILYVKDFHMANSAQLNAEGSTAKLHMYHSGSGTLAFGNSSVFRGSMFINEASLDLANSTSVTGHIITGGPRVSISNGVSADIRVIYAPNADVQLSNSAELKGALIGKTVTLSNSAKVTWADPSGEDGGLDDFGSRPANYARGLWY
ncbi:MAG: DUF7305 domain-containing protein [Bacillota bacterium]|jgi:hypothetical protein